LTSLSGLSYVSASFVKMTASGTFSLDTNSYYLSSNPSGFTSNVGTVTSVAALTLGTTGTDLSSTVATGTTTPVITLNVPTASASNRGALSSTDWSTFNSKQAGSTNLTSLSGLTFASTAFVKMTAAGTFALDTTAYGTGTVTSVSVTTANGVSGSVATNTTTPAITLTLGAITPTTVNGLTLTAAASGFTIAGGTTSKTLTVSNTLSLAGTDTSTLNIGTGGTLGTAAFTAYQPSNTNLTSVAGLTFASTSFVKMTATGTFALDTTTYYPSSNPSGFTSNTGTVTSVAALTIATAGTDITSSVATGTTTPVITLNIPTASASNRGALSSADWTTFNGKQDALTLTTTGTSGAATLVGNTLNIPNYASGGGSGTVTSVSVVSANGFAGTVATGTTTPAITLSTTITGLLKGNGTSISAAVAGTDYLTSVGISNLTATGTPSSTTYLRGDNTWATISGGGSPGGTTGQIQYNNAGAFGGATRTKVDANGNINLALDTAPPTSATDTLTLYNSKIGGRNMIGMMDPTGLGNIIQTHVARNGVSWWSTTGNSTTIIATGNQALTATGTATAANIATTNIQTRMKRLEYLVTTAATTAIAGFRGPALQWWMGNAANSGGFHFICRFGPATGVATTTSRMFVGMSNVTTAPTDIEPSTQTNFFGVGYDAADATFQFMQNAAVTTTKTSLTGFTVPIVDRTSMYELAMFCAPNSTTLTYTFTDLGTGTSISGTATANLPAVNTLLAPRGWCSAGGTSSVIGIALSSLYIETDY
jgi:hypothetical protein